MGSQPQYIPSVVRTLLSDQLKLAGFKPIRANWRREIEEAYHTANIQRSTFGPYFFLNFAIVFKAVEPGFVPHRAFGHIQFRAGDQGEPGFKGLTARMLDETYDFSEEERREFIAGPMWRNVEATFQQFSSLEVACAYARLPREERLRPTVYRKLLEYCGVPIQTEIY